jgi:hypothetical protein
MNKTTLISSIHSWYGTITPSYWMVTRKIRNDGVERGMIVYGYKFRPVMK